MRRDETLKRRFLLRSTRHGGFIKWTMLDGIKRGEIKRVKAGREERERDQTVSITNQFANASVPPPHRLLRVLPQADYW